MLIFHRPRCSIAYSIFNLHRDPDYWGPTGKFFRLCIELLCAHVHSSANEFDPDRFLDDRVGKYLVPNPFIFLPFNGGPRICLGQQVRLTL